MIKHEGRQTSYSSERSALIIIEQTYFHQSLVNQTFNGQTNNVIVQMTAQIEINLSGFNYTLIFLITNAKTHTHTSTQIYDRLDYFQQITTTS